MNKIKIEELSAWKPYIKDYFLDVLNNPHLIKEFREDILSFRNTKYYTGVENKYKKELKV